MYIHFSDVDMPEHDLEPPHFSKKALERILNNWTAVCAMLNDGTNTPVYEFISSLGILRDSSVIYSH